jgi:23S rRNA G2069 N7-methylase RlmK/C1962 C5-methylase RlmI
MYLLLVIHTCTILSVIGLCIYEESFRFQVPPAAGRDAALFTDSRISRMRIYDSVQKRNCHEFYCDVIR